MKKTAYKQEDFKWVNWKPSQIKKLAEEAIKERKTNYEKIKIILPEKRNYENTVWALANSGGDHAHTLSKMGLLVETSPNKDVRDTIHNVTMVLTDKIIEMEYDRLLYTSLLEYYEGNFSDEKKNLRKEDIKLLEDTILEYRRAGFDLKDSDQKKLKSLMKKSSKLADTFRKNINDYTDFILCSKEELYGLSERVISSLSIDEITKKYKVTLAYPHSWPFMAEAKNREKRKELAEKLLQKGGKKNLKIINDLVSLRAEKAKILGYKHHADFRTETRMAKNAENVTRFQNDLLKKLIKPAKRDIDALKAKAKSLGLKRLEHYDISYVADSLKKELFNLDTEETRSYFPLDYVVSQMMNMFGDLFSFTFKKTDFKLWHKDVFTYEIKDKVNKKLFGYISFDLFPREGKYGHACCVPVISSFEKSFKGEDFVTPFTVIVCNFPLPFKKNPSLISVTEVEYLFHEFGHALHMTLSNTAYEAQSGSNVSWDFVETPSQIMENFVYNEKSLKKLSKHFKTGKSIPKEMIDNILNAKKFQNGYHFMRQIIQGKLDFDWHTGKIKDANKYYKQLMKKYLFTNLPEKETLFPAGFGHIGGGYDAGYYSYLWALVYAQDVFSEFEKKEIFDKEVGMRWRKEVLEKGSSEDEMKLIKGFLGRKPNQKAFLKEIGV